MKPTKLSTLLVLALALVVAGAGCKKTPTKITRIPGDDAGGISKVKNEGANPDFLKPAEPVVGDNGPLRTGPGTGLNTFPNGRNGLNNGAGPNGAGTGLTTQPIIDLSNTNIGLADPNSFNGTERPEILAKDSIYFDFDSSTVKTSEKAKAVPAAEYLKSNPKHKVRIYGNCDERGTEEYNRSLGERRALALRTELLQLGVESDRIDTVTNGKDKPKASGHDEAAWHENRRGDFVVLVPETTP